jgi:hypothetical protein
MEVTLSAAKDFVAPIVGLEEQRLFPFPQGGSFACVAAVSQPTVQAHDKSLMSSLDNCQRIQSIVSILCALCLYPVASAHRKPA